MQEGSVHTFPWTLNPKILLTHALDLSQRGLPQSKGPMWSYQEPLGDCYLCSLPSCSKPLARAASCRAESACTGCWRHHSALELAESLQSASKSHLVSTWVHESCTHVPHGCPVCQLQCHYTERKVQPEMTEMVHAFSSQYPGPLDNGGVKGQGINHFYGISRMRWREGWGPLESKDRQRGASTQEHGEQKGKLD